MLKSELQEEVRKLEKLADEQRKELGRVRGLLSERRTDLRNLNTELARSAMRVAKLEGYVVRVRESEERETVEGLLIRSETTFSDEKI